MGQWLASRRRDNGKWRARYRDDAGKEHARHFERKVDAQRWLDEVTADRWSRAPMSTRKAGKATFDAWFASGPPGRCGRR